MSESNLINIDILKKGLPGITEIMGSNLVEACVVCLHRSNHLSKKTKLRVRGDIDKSFVLNWEHVYTDQVDRCWMDQEEATEFGAAGISILIVMELTNLVVLERSMKGTGFDYWLGDPESDDILFQKKARLEVSGIFRGNDGTIISRVKDKLEQMQQSDHFNIPGYVSVIEFSSPIAAFKSKR